MSWLSRLFAGQEAGGLTLTAEQQQSIANWRQLPEPELRRSHFRSRYVAVDVEASGINVRTDRLRAIAAMTVAAAQLSSPWSAEAAAYARHLKKVQRIRQVA